MSSVAWSRCRREFVDRRRRRFAEGRHRVIARHRPGMPTTRDWFPPHSRTCNAVAVQQDVPSRQHLNQPQASSVHPLQSDCRTLPRTTLSRSQFSGHTAGKQRRRSPDRRCDPGRPPTCATAATDRVLPCSPWSRATAVEQINLDVAVLHPVRTSCHRISRRNGSGRHGPRHRAVRRCQLGDSTSCRNASAYEVPGSRRAFPLVMASR